MRRLTRYILLELVKVFVITLAAMTSLMIIVGVAQEAVKQGLGPEPILRLVPYVLPNALRFAVPGTILFAACSVYGRMSASNEVVAVKSLGVSPVVLLRPAFVLAFMVSLVAVWLNDVAVTWGRRGVHRVVLQSVEQIAYGMLRTQRSYSTRRFAINVKRVDGRKLIRVTMTFHSGGDSPPVLITAEQAELRCNTEQNALNIVLTNGMIEVGDQATFIFPDTIEREIPLSDASKKGGVSHSPSALALRRIPIEIREQRDQIQRLRQQYAAEAAYQLQTGAFHAMAHQAWRERTDKLDGEMYRLHRLYTEPWRRWANGFSCFFFVLVGAPMAMRLRNADLWTTFGICFLPILLAYYPLLAYGVDRAKAGAVPPYTVWLGNLMLLLWGLWLLRRVARY